MQQPTAADQLSDWQRRQVDGIEFLIAYDTTERRIRRRLYATLAGFAVVAYGGAAAASYIVIR